MPSRVSVVIISFNTRDKLRRCLQAVGKECRTIVIDNASSDGSADMVASDFPETTLVRNKDNRGFGAANNQGAELAEESGTDLILYLNSDAYADPGAIAKLASVFDDAGIVAAGGRLLNPDRSLQASTAGPLDLWAVFCEQTLLEKAFPKSRFLSPYWNTSRLPGDRLHDTAQVMGASLMVRAGLERFDERYFMYCEDTDLCKRLSRHGRIVYVPQATFTHDLGSSSSGARWMAVARYNRGKELYFAIHHGLMAAACCWILDRLGALLRLTGWSLLSVARPAKRAQAALFLRVLLAPIRGPRASIRR